MASPLIASWVDSAGGGGGEDEVVGFTTKFIPGGTVLNNVSRVFKLKYLKQLIEVCRLITPWPDQENICLIIALQVVDFLNLRLGIVYGDISLWNLLIDGGTNDLKVLDFNFGVKLW